MRFLVLGPIEVSGAAGTIDPGGPQQRALLGRLILDANRVVSVDRLAAAVWDDDPPPSAQGSLQVLVSKLRKVLRDDEHATSPVARRGSGYAIEVAAEDTDLGAFVAGCAVVRAATDAGDWPTAVAAAEAALALWRGPVLGELADREWVRVAAVTLEEQRTACELDLVRALLGCDRVSEAVARCRGIDEEQPLREDAAWLFALALHRSGRSPDALDVLRRFGARLDDELGLDPGPAIRDLQAGILRQDAALLSWPRTGRPDTAASEPDGPVPAVVEPDLAMSASDSAPIPSGFVGRGPELTLAARVLASATDDAAWLVLAGEAGIGKTALAEQIIGRWGGRVARSSCPDDDGVPLWWPIRQLLDALDLDSAAVLATPPDADADAARYAVYDAVSRALANVVATGPCLLLVEDIHWADDATLRLLNHLAGSAPGALAGLAVVLTSRPVDGNGGVPRLLATVARRADSRTITLPPLTAGEVAELTVAIGGAPVARDDAVRLAMRTGGNPFFVCEYARLPPAERERGDVPVVVSAVLERRIGVLDADVLQVLRSAAVIGDTLDIDLLCRVSRLDLDELADLLDEAADERIIVAGSGGYVFSHALVRDQLLAGLSGMRRQRLHLRVAAVVSGDNLDTLVRRASHLVAAGPLADSADVFAACRAAAAESDRRLEPEPAARWWGHAIEAFDQIQTAGTDLPDRDELVVAQLAALARSGRGQTVLDVIDAALIDAARRDRPDSIARFASTLLRTSGSWPWAIYGSDPGPLVARLTGLESLMQAHPRTHVRILAALAVGSCYAPDPAVSDELSRRSIEIAEQLADDAALADALLGRALAFSGVAARAAESLTLLARLRDLGRPPGLDDAIAHGLGYLARISQGDVDAAAEHVRQGSAISDMLRLSTSRVQFRWAETSLRSLRANDVAELETLLDAAIELHRQTELYESGTFDIALFTLRWEQGRLSRAEFGQADPRVMPWAGPYVAVAERDPAARELIAAELARPVPPMWITHYRLTMLAHAVADLGAVEFAADLLAQLAPLDALVANAGQVAVAGPVAYAAARLHALAGDRGEALAAAALAIDVATAAGAPRWVRAARTFADQVHSDNVPEHRH